MSNTAPPPPPPTGDAAATTVDRLDVPMRWVARLAAGVLGWVRGRRGWVTGLAWLALWPFLLPLLWIVRRPTSRAAHGSLAVVLLLAAVVGAAGPPAATTVPVIDDVAGDSSAPTTPAPDDAGASGTPSDSDGDLEPSPTPSPSPSASPAGIASPTADPDPGDVTSPQQRPTAAPDPQPTPAPDESPLDSGSAGPRGDSAPVIVQGRVVDVVDGDTVDLADGTRIRLAIVDTPEVHGGFETCGPEASDFTARFLAGQTVAVHRPDGSPPEDRFGRTLGEVVRVTDGASLNVALAAAGLATVDERFTDEDPDLARRARAAQATAADPDCTPRGDDTDDAQDPAPPAPAPADPGTGTGTVTIVTIRYDAPGNDVEVHNDSEYVQLSNGGTSPVDIGGWTLTDAKDNSITLPSGFQIPAGGTFRVHTGSGDDDPNAAHHAGRGQAIWNNSGGDTAVLTDRSGATIDTYSYSS